MAYAIHLNEGTEEEVKKLLQQADGWIEMMGEGEDEARGKLQDGNEFEEFNVDSNIEIDSLLSPKLDLARPYLPFCPSLRTAQTCYCEGLADGRGAEPESLTCPNCYLVACW